MLLPEYLKSEIKNIFPIRNPVRIVLCSEKTVKNLIQSINNNYKGVISLKQKKSLIKRLKNVDKFWLKS